MAKNNIGSKNVEIIILDIILILNTQFLYKKIVYLLKYKPLCFRGTH